MVSKTALLILGLGALPLSFAQVTEDFEGGWDQAAWPTYAKDCNQGGKVALDSTTAHSGKNSIRVDGAGGYCGHIFVGTTKVPASGDVYVRTFVKAAKAFTDSHVTFIVMPDSAEGPNKHLRVGGMSKVLLFNRESDDATLPDLSPQGVATSVGLTANTWQCFEYHLGADGSIETWLDNALIPGLTTAGAANPNSNGWQRGAVTPKITGVYFGWESYASDANTFWYDDIAIGSTRIGCEVGGPPQSTPPVSSTPSPSSTTTRSSTSSTSSTPTPRCTKAAKAKRAAKKRM